MQHSRLHVGKVMYKCLLKPNTTDLGGRKESRLTEGCGMPVSSQLPFGGTAATESLILDGEQPRASARVARHSSTVDSPRQKCL